MKETNIHLVFLQERDQTTTMPEHVTIPVSIPSPVVPAFQLDQQSSLPPQGGGSSSSSSSSRKRPASPSSPADEEEQQQQRRRDSSPKRSRSGTRELLTEEEKRANHIASEQKRRNTIRKGFKEMTEIIPTLKNINNSKSTILFKAVEYIKHLDKRNRNLREKIASLQMRVEVKRRMGALGGTGSGGGLSSCPADPSSSPFSSSWTIPAVTASRRNTFAATSSSSSMPPPHDSIFRRTSDAVVVNQTSGLPANAMAALLVHKNQQKQLEFLQEQLALRRGFQPWSSSSSSSSSSSTYNSISIPASNVFENPAHPLSFSSSSPSSSSSHHHRHHSNSQATVNTTGIISSSSYAPTAALVVPMTDDDHCVTTAQTTTASVMGTPCLTIPADEEFGNIATQHNGLLTCAKFGNRNNNENDNNNDKKQ